MKKNEQNREDIKQFSESELETLFREANSDIPFRVNYYANLLGVTFNKITIKKMKTQWGSCSSKSNLNFNCLLMLCPEDIRNYVVVHELCHRIEMNHSRNFWNIVERILPDYRTCVKWLKDYGGALISRL